MHILFLTHYYPPESNAPANRVSELAKEWVAAGHQVTVATCTPNHPGGQPFPGYGNPFFFRETMAGVNVIRLGTFLAANEGVARRSLNYLSYLLAVAANVFRLPKADIVVSTSPQFFSGIAGGLVSMVRRIPWVFEVRDIWPESVAAVSAIKKGPALRVLEWLERWAYRRADQVVAVSPAFIEHITERGPLRRPVAIVENGASLDLFDGMAEAGEFRRAHGLEGKVVFGYIGTHGMAHQLQTLLEAAELTRDDPTIAYLMVGSGAERERLVAHRAAQGLDNVVMLDHQPRSEMPAIWANIDVSVVMLRRSDLFLKVIPSKMFEAMAMSRPMIMTVDGQAREIMERGGCGLYVEPEDPAALAGAIRRIAADHELREGLGSCGRRFVQENYDRSVLARRYLDIIAKAVSPA